MQFILKMINLDWIRNNILEVHVTLICKCLRKKSFIITFTEVLIDSLEEKLGGKAAKNSYVLPKCS